MKRALQTVGGILLILYALLPAGTLIATAFDYTLVLTHPAACAIITAAVSVAAALVSWLQKGFRPNKAARLFYAVCGPLAGVNWLFYLFQSSTVTVIVCMLVSFLCAALLTIRFAAPFVLKLISGILVALMLLPLVFINFIAHVFGDFGANTVVRTVPSPDGGYYAEVIDSDQGAHGGDTLVYVYDSHKIDTRIFEATKTPQRVYVGEWRAYEAMSIYWEDDNTLIINGERYFIE